MKYTKSFVAMVFILMSFLPIQASASETQAGASGTNVVQNEIVMAAQSYKSRWDQVGGSWTTGWVRNQPEPICISGAHCICNGQNLCGTFNSGQTNYWWPRGCHKPAVKIRCTSVPE